jgi:hypothetical protein
MKIFPNGERIKCFGFNRKIPNCVGTILNSYIHESNVFYVVRLDYEYQGYINSELSRSLKEELSYISTVIVCADGAKLA